MSRSLRAALVCPGLLVLAVAACGGSSTTTPEGECVYDGDTYAVGDTFPAQDGCNTCSCDADGSVACTEIGCDGGPDVTGGAACKVNGIVYESGASGIPDPTSCNKCSCDDGQLICTEINCPTECPPDRVYGTQCAQCGPTDACEVVEHGCLRVCDQTCDTGACVDGVCKTLCG